MARRDQPRTPTQPLGAPTQVRLTFDQRTAVEVIAAGRTVAIGAVIREAVDRYLRDFVDAEGRSILEAAEAGELDHFTVPDLGDDEA